MPGILPMKVIKLGSTAQSRIAQACDRCRSKKIRCDGIRPCCSQCATVGFECKTSDKLSRRAFPRGYTESLEERVRHLEAEVRELKDLLDEKDEKIDMLSKMHSDRRPSMADRAAHSPVDAQKEAAASKDEIFRVQASPLLLRVENSDSYFMGASSGRAFVDTFNRRIEESGRSLTGFDADAFVNIQASSTPNPHFAKTAATAPPRMFSDRCLNIYFQEWAPLFPVLHKPAFLEVYEEYMVAPESVRDNHKLAQLHLVFCIAALSSNMPDSEHIQSCERQWHSSLDAILMDNTLLTLQCLVLAVIYCISKADYVRLQHYKGIAVGLSHRLGLHQNQKLFSFGTLTIEKRKKVFWTLYTIDCFSAASLGLPKLLKEEDIHAEYPVDTDDECLTEKGFQPIPTGESTKISSALALFRASRILSKVLEQNYPSAVTHDISLRALLSLEHELNQWSDNLPTHLKLTFMQDKPSTEVTGSRSALLSLAYYYIRSLIHRPAVGSTLGQKSSPSVISLADSSKHIIQIIELLEERSMSFSFCLNKNECLTLCGLSLLYQGLDLKQEGKLMQDGHRLVRVVIAQLENSKASVATEFKRLACSLGKLEIPTQSPVERNFKHDIAASKYTKSFPPPSSTRKHLQPHLKKSLTPTQNVEDSLVLQDKLRRVTVPDLGKPSQVGCLQQARQSMNSLRLESMATTGDYRNSAPVFPETLKLRLSQHNKMPNLDYLSLSNTPLTSPQPILQHRTGNLLHDTVPLADVPPHSTVKDEHNSTIPADWEALLCSLDAGQPNIYDAIYGSTPLTVSKATYPSQDLWLTDSSQEMASLSAGEFLTVSAPSGARSVPSFSEDSLSSGEDLSASDYRFSSTSLSSSEFNQAMGMHRGSSDARVVDEDGYLIGGLDEIFGT